MSTTKFLRFEENSHSLSQISSIIIINIEHLWKSRISARNYALHFT